MKTLIFLFSLLCLSNLSSQTTDWAPFPEGQKTYFEYGDSVFLFYNDSTTIDVRGNIHYFGAKYYYRNWEHCQDQMSNMLSEQDYQLPDIKELYSDTSHYYQVYQNDTLRFYQHTEPGESWSIAISNHPDYDEIRIHCTQLTQQYILGYEDWVKTFQVEAFQQGNAVPSVFDAIQFELAQHIGFIKYIPLEWLKTPPENMQSVEITGFEKEGQAYGFTSSFADYFHHFEAGDVYKWKGDYFCQCYDYSENTRWWWRDSITAVSSTPDEVTLTFNRTSLIQQSITGPDPVNDTTFITKIGLTRTFSKFNPDFELGHNYDVDFNLGNWVSVYQVDPEYQTVFHTSPLYKDSTGKVDFRYRLAGILNNEDCLLEVNENSWYSVDELKEDIGPVYEYEFSGYGYFGEHNIRRLEMIGYTKNGVTSGDNDPITSIYASNRDNLNFNLFPNPATVSLNIQLPDGNFRKALRWAVYNSTGGYLLEGKARQTSFQVEVETLPPGIYFLKVWDENYLGIKKWIKL